MNVLHKRSKSLNSIFLHQNFNRAKFNFNKSYKSKLNTFLKHRSFRYNKPNYLIKKIEHKKIEQNKKIEEYKYMIFNQPYVLKKNYNSIIPLDIYQTWYTKDLPTKMKERVELLKLNNPRFKHHLYDDNDCREFIKTHFRPDVLHAFDSLIPGAYKADLWRYCILYINGGIYLDIKLSCVNGFKLIELTETNHLVKDRPINAIFNSFMVSTKKNILLFKAIRQIVANVKNKFYGEGPLYPTGPELLGKIIINNKINENIDLFHYKNGGYIIYKNRFVISTEYPDYDNERLTLYNKIHTKRYDKLWHERNIYK